ncbi:adenylyltransferase and sulfurtransferase MOCS3-like [Hyposmocoma kahamanoa]|uniref:adenylyltransferase and sulfurtransferase MOCS3-like n=1 Tax=Hyposmocoma kahamanoa TaxID=1477025 RepID=UPI000E6D972D|nr:adenylyltransferase and sulfurtransferase MOCS3-like [Hyposmocoma kahamanoa]
MDLSSNPNLGRYIESTAKNAPWKLSILSTDFDLHLLPPENRITALQLASKLNETERPLLVDVRNPSEFGMCAIDGAVNYPIDSLRDEKLDALLEDIKACCREVTFICRRGNDSQIAAKRVIDALDIHDKERITDLTGGLHAWGQYVDKDFPIY